MPTETFDNLPAEKREKLLAAIRREVGRVPFAEASINRIVQDAGIPRGSYYQYFRDRDDLFHYMMRDYIGAMRRCAEETLAHNRGDVFAALLAAFDLSARAAGSPEDVAPMKNLLSYYWQRQEPSAACAGPDALMQLLRDNVSRIDASRFRYGSEEELISCMEILLAVFKQTVLALFRSPESAPALRQKLVQKLEIVRRGMLLEPARGEGEKTI